MFTSRAEYRLLLREDNADLRLSHYGHQLGLIDDKHFEKVAQKAKDLAFAKRYLSENFTTPSKENSLKLKEIDEDPVTDKVALKSVVGRKTFTIDKLDKFIPEFKNFSKDTKEQILVESKYANYIEKQQKQIDSMKDLIKIKIPKDFEFEKVSGLSKEIIEKFNTFNPPTLHAASQISGVTPAAIDILHIYIKIEQKSKKT
jgi:tRNA uridine 5-carboxymethylaminomethyl modification enzyme